MRNYKVLSLSSGGLKALAWISLVLGIISAAIAFLEVNKSGAPLWIGVVSLLSGVMYFFVFFIGAEVIKLLLDIHRKVFS